MTNRTKKALTIALTVIIMASLIFLYFHPKVAIIILALFGIAVLAWFIYVVSKVIIEVITD